MTTAAPIDLDHNATTAPAPEVVAAMLACLTTNWANPSSTHGPGQAARRTLVDARARVAALVGCQASELVFTSGASEANHMAVLGALALGRRQGRHRLVLSAVEHPGLLALAERLRGEGTPVDLIGVDAQGRLDLDQARRLMRDDLALVSLMGANNETGVIMPIDELAELAHGAGARLHVDATQLLGKSTARFEACGADLWSVSAHKIHGPKGVGALAVRKGLALPPLLSGRQERQRRGGTENLPGIAGFAAAADVCRRTLDADLAHMRTLQLRLESGLIAALPGLHRYAGLAPRLPNTSCLRFGGLDADQVLGRLERAGVLASSGAACSAGGTQPSHVLLAMGVDALHARAAVRFSLGRDTTAEQIDRAIGAVIAAIGPLLRDDSTGSPTVSPALATIPTPADLGALA